MHQPLDHNKLWVQLRAMVIRMAEYLMDKTPPNENRHHAYSNSPQLSMSSPVLQPRTLSLVSHSRTNRCCFENDTLQHRCAFGFTQSLVDFLSTVLLVQGQGHERCFPDSIFYRLSADALPSFDTHLPTDSAKRRRFLVSVLNALSQTGLASE